MVTVAVKNRIFCGRGYNIDDIMVMVTITVTVMDEVSVIDMDGVMVIIRR